MIYENTICKYYLSCTGIQLEILRLFTFSNPVVYLGLFSYFAYCHKHCVLQNHLSSECHLSCFPQSHLSVLNGPQKITPTSFFHTSAITLSHRVKDKHMLPMEGLLYQVHLKLIFPFADAK